MPVDLGFPSSDMGGTYRGGPVTGGRTQGLPDRSSQTADPEKFGCHIPCEVELESPVYS